MTTPFVRARWCAPAAPLLFSLLLAGCGGQERAQARLAAAQAQLDPPRLWLVESLGPTGATADGEIMVCADSAMREGFRRANAEVNGEPCVTPRAGFQTGDLYATR